MHPSISSELKGNTTYDGLRVHLTDIYDLFDMTEHSLYETVMNRQVYD